MISNLSEIIRERIKDKRIIKIRVKTSNLGMAYSALILLSGVKVK